ncbi:MAG: SCP2 sterol-binding domain-containing protein [Acidimicrobiia bacterium]
MGVQFLSEGWTEAVTTALNSHEGFKGAVADVDLTIQFTVSDAPDGDVHYHFQASGGNASVELGEVEDSDVQIANDYETAVAITKGELNTESAFFSGKLKATGNLAKLMMHTNVISQWRAANEGIEVDF